MTVVGTATLRLLGDTAQFEKRMEGAAAKMQATGAKMRQIGGKLTTAVSLPLAGIGIAAIKMASDAEEAGNKFDVVMGGSAERVRNRLQELTETIPLTRFEMEKLAGGIQDMLVPMGLARDNAADMSADMVELAGDLASFNDVPTTQVLEAMQSALAGSSEPMRRFGVDTRVTRLKTLALTEGIIEEGEELDNTTMALAVMAAIQADSTDAMGDAERTIDSTSNSLKFLWRDIKDLGITIGDILIPAVTPMIKKLGDALEYLKDLSPKTQKIIVGVAALAAALGPLLVALGMLVTAVGAISSGITTLLPLLAGLSAPVLAAVAAFAALVLAGKAIIDNWKVLSYEAGKLVDGAVGKVVGAFSWMKDKIVGNSIVPDMMSGIKGEFGKLDPDMGGAAESAATRVNEAFKNIVNPESLRSMDFDVTLDAEDLYAAVIEQGEMAASSLHGMSGRLIKGTGDLSDFTGAVVEGEATTEAQTAAIFAGTETQVGLTEASVVQTEKANALTGAMVTMSAEGQAAMDRQVAALDRSETALKVEIAAREFASDVQDSASFKLQSVGKSATSLVANFTPLGMLANVLEGALDALEPAITALKAPLRVLGKIVGAALMPILKAWWPIIKLLAITATYLVEGFLYLQGIIYIIAGNILKGVGWLLRGIGKAIDKIPFVSGEFAIKAGQGMMDAGENMAEAGHDMWDATEDVKEGREELKEMEWPEDLTTAQEDTTESQDGTTDAVTDTDATVEAVGSKLLDLTSTIRDALLSIRDLTIEGVDYLGVLASGPSALQSGAGGGVAPTVSTPAMANAVSGGQSVEVAPGAVSINVSEREDPRRAGEEAAEGFLGELTGREFKRTQRQVTRSGRMDIDERRV